MEEAAGPGIRYYSGTATYETTLDVPEGREFALDLGWNRIKERRPFKFKKEKSNIHVQWFMQSPDVCVHQETQVGEKPYSFHLCTKKFPHDPRCMLQRTQPKRSLSTVSTVKKLSTTEGTSCSHSGLKPYMCPECHVPSAPWGLSHPTRKPIPNQWP